MNKNKSKKPKIIVILGPTAAGKSSLGIELAKDYNGEIVSADSRQVYKKMDLGTGKVTIEEQKIVPHFLLDVASPKDRFDVVEFQKLATKRLHEIDDRAHLPFLVGGSPFYIYSIVEGWQFPPVKPKPKLRKKLRKKTAAELFEMLEKLDPEQAAEEDPHNKRRLIRKIEIAKELGSVPDLKNDPQFDSLLIGLKFSREDLSERIAERLEKRFKEGMIEEVKNLHDQDGVSWEKLEKFGLEYRWIARYLQEKISKEEMKERLQKDIEHFSKRQMTWFKKDDRIHWVNSKNEASKLLEKFINKNSL